MWNWNTSPGHASEKDDNFTYLGRGVDFKGVINFNGTIRIDGRFEGEVHSNGTLIVGESAFLKGFIYAGTVIAQGKISANVTAKEKIQLHKPAVLVGELRTPKLSIEEGVHYHGFCGMGADCLGEETVMEADNVHSLSAHRDKLRA